jgi:hypothetical protein
MIGKDQVKETQELKLHINYWIINHRQQFVLEVH